MTGKKLFKIMHLIAVCAYCEKERQQQIYGSFRILFLNSHVF